MSQLNLAISSRRDDATLKSMFETPGTSPKHETAQRLINFLTSLTTGTELGPSGAAPTVAISIEGQATAATATLTVSSTGSSNGETCVVANTTLTAKTSGAVPASGEFNISATPATQATSMALAINSVAALSGIVTAAAVSGVVTITAVQKGLMGNGLQLSEGLTNVAAVAFSGGAADPTAKTLSF
jgi:hypothetical protein